MSPTDKIATKTSEVLSCNEPLPENLAFFLMANANQHRVHFGKLILCCAAIFAALAFLGVAVL